MPSLPRRWLIVAALFAVTFGISMPLAAYGVFLPIIAETFGWSRGAISAALSLNLVLGGITGFFVGRLADRHGPRVMLLVTVGLAGTGFGLISMIGALWQLYALVGLVAGTGMSSFYLLSTATVAHWFPDRRGLAIALVLIGFNLGYMVSGPLAAWLIPRLGWRPAYAVIGFGCATLALVAASTVRLPRATERHALAVDHAGRAHPVGGVTLRQALADSRFWCLNVSWLLLGGTIFMFSVHAVSFARDQGVTLAIAALALTAYGVGSVIGRLVSGTLSDRLGTRTTMRAGYVVELARARAARRDADAGPAAARDDPVRRRGGGHRQHAGEGDPRPLRAARDRRHHGHAHARVAQRRRAGTGGGGLPLRRDGLVRGAVLGRAGARGDQSWVLFTIASSRPRRLPSG